MYILCRNFDGNCILCEKLAGLEKVTKLGVWPHAKLRVRPKAMTSCETKFAPPVKIGGYEGPETGG